MCCSNESLFHKKKNPEHGPHFLQKYPYFSKISKIIGVFAWNFEKYIYFSRKIPKNGYILPKIMTLKNGYGFRGLIGTSVSKPNLNPPPPSISVHVTPWNASSIWRKGEGWVIWRVLHKHFWHTFRLSSKWLILTDYSFITFCMSPLFRILESGMTVSPGISLLTSQTWFILLSFFFFFFCKRKTMGKVRKSIKSCSYCFHCSIL